MLVLFQHDFTLAEQVKTEKSVHWETKIGRICDSESQLTLWYGHSTGAVNCPVHSEGIAQTFGVSSRFK